MGFGIGPFLYPIIDYFISNFIYSPLTPTIIIFNIKAFSLVISPELDYIYFNLLR